MKKLYSNKWVILSLVLPGLLLFFFAILAPICLSVYYGFTDYSGMGQAHFIGWQNYKKLIVDANFWMCEIPYCWPSALSVSSIRLP